MTPWRAARPRESRASRGACLPLALAVLFAMAGPAAGQQGVGGQVLPALDGTVADGANWAEYNGTTPAGPLRADERVVGRHRPGWYYGLTWTWSSPDEPSTRLELVQLDAPSPQGPRFLAGYVAASGARDSRERPFILPTVTLQELPQPRATRTGDQVTVEWEAWPEEVPGLFGGWRLYHSFDGVAAWRRAAETLAADGTRVTLTIPPDCAAYFAVRPFFAPEGPAIVGPDVEASVHSTVSDRLDAAAVDADLDFACDAIDNCLGLANEAQADHDGDGVGDLCDGDAPPFYIETFRSPPPGRPTAPRFELARIFRTANSSSEYALVAGTLRRPFRHDHLVLDPRDCAVVIVAEALERAIHRSVTPVEGDRYFLVGAVQPTGDRDYGDDSRGGRRPREAPLCP